MQQIAFRAMGCTISAVIDDDGSQAEAGLHELPAWFNEWERTLSRFLPSSELSRLNTTSAEWVEVSSTLWEVLEAALVAADWSEGLVTPTVRDAIVRLGYAQDFESMTASLVLANTASLPTTQPSASWRSVERDPTRHAVRLLNGATLDLGGIAKGWCAEQAAKRLARVAPVLVDAGGDIAVASAPHRSTRFPIGIANPRQPDQLLATIGVSQGFVATSGQDYRYWFLGTYKAHHIVNPTTGLPAQTDVLTATVIASEAWKAEAAAKKLVLLGSDTGRVWLQSHRDLAALLVLKGGQLWQTTNFNSFLWQGSR